MYLKSLLLRHHKTLAAAAAAGSIGVYMGAAHERSRLRDNTAGLVPRPGLPLFGSVSAATALAPSPSSSAPAVAVPPKTEMKEPPEEPPPGISRIAEIMRFGFPGLDNIRSRRWACFHYRWFEVGEIVFPHWFVKSL